ncbi:esterase [Swaminathania salitolerans LMG 21291]|uniref:S-formylglutathione hydrolase n=2 Tax=Swaminathania salitolerans TaxID=182838 RepID=A0A511BNM0_9PROT|nr:S-formylglutathione hydrolase [Swaminathania salitolerans]GBQ16290.1 esterase [Swaminathania salitolerans LMG 21291]GEL01662.1 S-formylglutathione hydrolase [Swaminathania salitolerans]
MTVSVLETHRCHGGEMRVFQHDSVALGLPARFSVFLPSAALEGEASPVLFLLAGLTCTHETFLQKSTIIAHAATHGLILVAPDTSPRGAGIEGEDESYDLGTGAGFYLDATRSPWSSHYRMGRYISEELPALLAEAPEVLPGLSSGPASGKGERAFGIMGHSMGGHGALVHALRNAGLWRSVSALAPIVHPSVVPWGEKAFSAYLGSDRKAWSRWDAVSLLNAGHRHPTAILIDQGTSDTFLSQELRPDLLEQAAADAGQALTLRYHDGYDHSYWFIQTVIADHVAHHAGILRGRA